jgi:hypothetical protein
MASKDLIDTLIAEAGGEGDAGLIAAAWAIQQRAAARGQTPDQVIKSGFDGYTNPGSGAKRAQQDPTLRAKVERIVNGVQAGTIPNPVPGADHFLSGDVMPSWAKSMKPVATIGGHRFYASGDVPQAAYGPLIPPGELPEVATLTDVVGPRVAPMPATMTPDLRQMRNPLQSVEAQRAQVTPLTSPPLPQRRPSAPDIVTPTMAALNAPRGNVNATRAVDMLASTQNPVTPRLTPDGGNIYSYHIPDMTPTTVTGGLGSLTPSPARARLPDLPPSNIGQPPTTRVVPSVPFNSAAQQPTAAQINDAARRASLTNTQSNVERALPPIPSIPSVGSSAANINAQRAEQLGQRVATAIPARLTPGNAAQAYDVSINGPAGLTRQQFAALPNPGVLPPIPSIATAAIPLPRRRPDVAVAPIRVATPPAARRQVASSPARIVVNGAGSYSAPPPLSPLQALRAQGMTAAQAYASLTAQRPTLEDRVRGSTGLSSSGASAYSISG